jgi:predicted metal-dependent hydrolase
MSDDERTELTNQNTATGSRPLQTMKEYHIGQTVVPDEIEWSPQRETIGLSIETDMELLVRAPLDASLDDVEEVLEDKKQWILETLYGISEQEDPPPKQEVPRGEKLLYNGRRYRLKVNDKPVVEPKLRFDGSRFELHIPEDQDVGVRRKRQTVVDWYANKAEEVLPERAERFIEKLGGEEVEIDVRELNRRWGKFQHYTVTLHWRLVLAPRKIQDYVIAHELAHLNHTEHSDAFWNTVGTLIPDYRDRLEWLRVNGATLRV